MSGGRIYMTHPSLPFVVGTVFSPRDATQSAVMLQYVVCPSVSPSVRPSVCPSVTLRYRDHTGWNTSKIFSRPNSSGWLQHVRPWCNGNTPKLGWNRGGAQKPAISLKRCKIGPRLLWQSNRKSHTLFRLVPKSMTLDDFERPKRTHAEKIVLRSPPEKFEWR